MSILFVSRRNFIDRLFDEILNRHLDLVAAVFPDRQLARLDFLRAEHETVRRLFRDRIADFLADLLTPSIDLDTQALRAESIAKFVSIIGVSVVDGQQSNLHRRQPPRNARSISR